jgi:hypothetical protein
MIPLPTTRIGDFRVVLNESVPRDEFWLGTEARLHKFRIAGDELIEYDRIERADDPPR